MNNINIFIGLTALEEVKLVMISSIGAWLVTSRIIAPNKGMIQKVDIVIFFILSEGKNKDERINNKIVIILTSKVKTITRGIIFFYILLG